MASKRRRPFSREFTVEAVRLTNPEGVPLSQMARDFGVGENLLRRWRTQYDADPTHAFGGPGRVAPRDTELVGLKRELARVTRERGVLKARRCTSPKSRDEVHLSGGVSGAPDGAAARRLVQWLLRMRGRPRSLRAVAGRRPVEEMRTMHEESGSHRRKVERPADSHRNHTGRTEPDGSD